MTGRPPPTRAEAGWHLADGPFAYVDGGIVPGTVDYDIAADETERPT
jgi:hypothetical protein